MEFVKGYMDDADYRRLLCDTTGEIFGFSFEDWYSSGFYAGEYIPYSFVNNGKLVANASANIMKMAQNGSEKLYIQIGTVMTRPEYRKQGLARELIQKILTDYEGKVDGFFLYGNLDAVGFYERLGFMQLNQWRYYLEDASAIETSEAQFKKAGERDLANYIAALNTAVVNPRMDQKNRTSLQLFYTGDLENVFYDPQLDTFAVMYMDEDTLYLDSIISATEVSVMDVLKRAGMPYKKVILGFTPAAEDAGFFTAIEYNGEDDYRFFYKGDALKEIAEEKLYFPVMSHA